MSYRSFTVLSVTSADVVGGWLLLPGTITAARNYHFGSGVALILLRSGFAHSPYAKRTATEGVSIAPTVGLETAGGHKKAATVWYFSGKSGSYEA
jgi:hypothetical protein